MTRMLALVLSLVFPVSGIAADATQPPEPAFVHPADDSDLSEFLWINRPVIVFADTAADPRFQQQIDLLTKGEPMLRERDVIVLTDTDPTAKSPLRKKLRPRGFQMVLIGKDGGVKLRKPFPWSERELSRSIDKFPLREQEIRDRRATN